MIQTMGEGQLKDWQVGAAFVRMGQRDHLTLPVVHTPIILSELVTFCALSRVKIFLRSPHFTSSVEIPSKRHSHTIAECGVHIVVAWR